MSHLVTRGAARIAANVATVAFGAAILLQLLMALNALGNFASSSVVEKVVFGPISLIMAASP